MENLDCGHAPDPPREDTAIVASGGWCAPSEIVRDLLDDEPSMCSDCRTRMLFASEIGFDPGPRGENLRVPRGGIQYGRKGRW